MFMFSWVSLSRSLFFCISFLLLFFSLFSSSQSLLNPDVRGVAVFFYHSGMYSVPARMDAPLPVSPWCPVTCHLLHSPFLLDFVLLFSLSFQFFFDSHGVLFYFLKFYLVKWKWFFIYFLFVLLMMYHLYVYILCNIYIVLNFLNHLFHITTIVIIFLLWILCIVSQYTVLSIVSREHATLQAYLPPMAIFNKLFYNFSTNWTHHFFPSLIDKPYSQGVIIVLFFFVLYLCTLSYQSNNLLYVASNYRLVFIILYFCNWQLQRTCCTFSFYIVMKLYHIYFLHYYVTHSNRV